MTSSRCVVALALAASLAAAPAGAAPLLPVAEPAVAPDPPRAGVLVGLPGWGRRSGPGTLHTYRVFVEAAVPVSPGEFASFVADILGDRRGWGSLGHAFRRVPADQESDFRIVLARAPTSERLCEPVETYGRYSCFDGYDAVVNHMRWRDGAPAYEDIERYRTYVVNHEIGHALHFGHTTCVTPGRRAPVMVQQTKGVGACRPNPWPALTGG